MLLLQRTRSVYSTATSGQCTFYVGTEHKDPPVCCSIFREELERRSGASCDCTALYLPQRCVPSVLRQKRTHILSIPLRISVHIPSCQYSHILCAGSAPLGFGQGKRRPGRRAPQLSRELGANLLSFITAARLSEPFGVPRAIRRLNRSVP